MAYAFGSKSLAYLAGVDPLIVEVAKLAIANSRQDFGITEPQLRTLAQEEHMVAIGASTTLHSHHLPQANGLGGALDLVPWDGAKFVWSWAMIYPIATAMQLAAARLGRKITWGGVWDMTMDQYGDPAAAEAAYVARRDQALPGRSVFVDGPHFELGAN